MLYKVIYKENINNPKMLFLVGWGQSPNELFANIAGLNFSFLAISLEGIDLSLTPSKVWEMEEYLNEIKLILANYNFKPDIIVSHSFGGKFHAHLLNLAKHHYFLAPNIFPKLLIEKLKIRAKIFINKRLRKYYMKHHKVLPKKYLGSTDYRLCNDIQKSTFKRYVDYCPSKELFKRISNINIVAFKDDESIPLKRIIKGCKKYNFKKPIILNGSHQALYLNPSEIIDGIRQDYELHN